MSKILLHRPCGFCSNNSLVRRGDAHGLAVIVIGPVDTFRVAVVFPNPQVFPTIILLDVIYTTLSIFFIVINAEAEAIDGFTFSLGDEDGVAIKEIGPVKLDFLGIFQTAERAAHHIVDRSRIVHRLCCGLCGSGSLFMTFALSHNSN